MAEKKPAEGKVEKKTNPEIQEKADEQTYAKDYIIYVDDAKNVPQDILDRQLVDVAQSALQCGLRATGEAKLESKKVLDENNVHLTYTLPVELNKAE